MSKALSLFILRMSLFLACFTPDHLYAITPNELLDRLDHISYLTFYDVTTFAKSIGCELYVVGGSVVKMAIQADNNDYSVNSILVLDPEQDVDLIVSGSLKQTEKVNAFLQSLHPEKKWDVGPMKSFYNDSFQMQHTDSLSTVALKISNEPGHSKLIDLRRDDHDPSEFIHDIIEHEIHFKYSSAHHLSPYFVAGKNPTLFQILRYFSEIIQYRLKPAKEDVALINKLLADEEKIQETSYISRRLGELWKKMFRFQMPMTLLSRYGFNTNLLMSKVFNFQKNSAALQCREVLIK